MNSRFYVHRATVSRQSSGATNLQRNKGLQEVFPALPCLVEPRPSIETPSQLGRITQGDYLMTWGVESVQVSDVVAWDERTFVVKRVIRDTARPFSSIPPYQVAELAEQTK